MQVAKTTISFILLAIMAACTNAPMQPDRDTIVLRSGNSNGGVVDVRLSNGFQTLAGEKTYADVSYYHLKLVDGNGDVIVDDTISGSASQFLDVPDGQYRLVADAMDVNHDSIVEGGEQTSDNWVDLTDGNATYSDDSGCLHVTLQLQNGTSGNGTITNSIEVLNGQPAETEPHLEGIKSI